MYDFTPGLNECERGPAALRRVSNLDFHVGVGEDHVEVVMDHSELFSQLCDQVLVHRILLVNTFHQLVVLWTTQTITSGTFYTHFRRKFKWLNVKGLHVRADNAAPRVKQNVLFDKH